VRKRYGGDEIDVFVRHAHLYESVMHS